MPGRRGASPNARPVTMGDAGGDGEDAPVHGDIVQPWDVGRGGGYQYSQQDAAEREPRGTSGGGRQQTFHEGLPRDAAAAGAERHAYAGFVAAAHGTDQQEVGDVHAGDEHDERGGAPERAEGVADIVNDVVA